MLRRIAVLALGFAALTAVPSVRADDPAPPTPETAAKFKETLILEVQINARRFQEFEQALLKLKQRYERSSKQEERERAALFDKALEQSKQEAIGVQFEQLSERLKALKLTDLRELQDAQKQSENLAAKLRNLLELIRTDNRTAELREQRIKIQELIRQIEKVIRDEKQIRKLTELGKTDSKELRGTQEGVRQRTSDIARAMTPKAGKGTEAKDPRATPKDAGKEGTNKGESKDAGKASEPKTGEAKDAGKGGEPKEGEAKGAPKDGKAGEPKDGKGGEAKAGDPKAGEPKAGQPKAGDPKAGNPKAGDPKAGQPKAGEPKAGSPGQKTPPGAAKGSKGGEAKKAEAKGGKSDGKGSPSEAKSGGQPKQGQAKAGSKSSSQSPSQPKSGQNDDQQQQQKAAKGDGNQKPQQNAESMAKKRVQDAAQEMRRAEEKIRQDKLPQAIPPEDKAITELEKARKRLEELLRQLREEEMERLLADLEARCHKMLAMQIRVRDGTVSVQKAIEINPDKKPSRFNKQDSLKLFDEQKNIVGEASKAIELIEQEGSAVAFAEVFVQVRDDMRNVQNRLGVVDVGKVTVSTEEDIISTLKEMIEALKKKKQDLQASKSNPSPPTPPPDQKLLDQIAELKMIRSMQLRVNARTRLYGQQYTGEQAEEPNIRREVIQLSERQERIFDVTNRIVRGDNK